MNDDQAVLQRIREMPETAMQTQVIEPLIRALGGTHVRKVHGPNERGKDFVYVCRDEWGYASLTVCQVKNSPFSGNSRHRDNSTAVLSQVIQARKTEVLNPETNRKECPDRVLLVTTYDLPDATVSDAGPLLNDVRANGGTVITPERLVEGIRRRIPHLYAELAMPGSGISQLILRYLRVHHEAVAFDLDPERPRFFVNLDLTGGNQTINALTQISSRRITRTSEIRLEDFDDLQERHAAIGVPVSRMEIITTPKGEKGYLNKVMAKLHGPALLDALDAVAKTLRAPATSASTAVELMARTLEFVSALVPVFGLEDELDLNAETTSPAFTVSSVDPESLVELRDCICVTGDAGAGKTSLVRAIAEAAIRKGQPCVYFPCQVFSNTEMTLDEAISDFVRRLAPDASSKSRRAYLDRSSIIVVDGCDEAPTFGASLGNAIEGMCSRPSVTALLPQEGTGLSIPRDMEDCIRNDLKHKRVTVARRLSSRECQRLRLLNNDAVARGLLDRVIHDSDLANPRIVVATRAADALALSDSFLITRVLPFTDPQLRNFYKRWFQDSPAKAEAVLTFLHENPRISEVCRIPIVASIVAALQEHGRELPRSKTEVYEKYFDLMLDRWDRSRHVLSRNRVSPVDKRMLLRRLAWNLHKEHRRHFALHDFAPLWETCLAQKYHGITAPDVLRELQFSNSVVHAVTRSQYTLGHLSFQEFLVAEQAMAANRAGFLAKRVVESWWAQVTVFYAGKCGDVEFLMSRIQRHHGLDVSKSPLFREILDEARFTPAPARAVIDEVMAYDEEESAAAEPGDDERFE